jgi:hypothetical protein
MSRRFPDYSLPFYKFYEKQQIILYKKLIDNGIIEIMAKDVIESGYYMTSEKSSVYDSYYSPQWALVGQFPFKDFLLFLNGQHTYNSIKRKTSTVSSVDEIFQILNSDPHSKHCLEQGSLSFRGQKQEYFTKRAIPNPSLANENSEERLIIPSIYRKYTSNFQSRIMDEKPQWVFETLLADDLVYYGMESPIEISKRNHEKYGDHSISDLQNFPEPENQEYYKRWSQIKVQGNYFPDIAIIAQHYGFQTYGLDLTFNPKVAAFFATHNFTWKQNDKADYNPVKNDEHEGIIYCFYFRAPQIRQTRDIINEIPAFEYINPLRPINQSCALPFFSPERFNEANQFLFHVFKIKKDFDISDLPSKQHLFPSKKNDKFYKACIDVKQKNEVWSDFVEYDF